MITRTTPLTPNLKALLLECITTEAMRAAKQARSLNPNNAADPLSLVGHVAMQIKDLPKHANAGFSLLNQSLFALRQAPDCPDLDDEGLAGRILERMRQRKK